MTEQNPKPVTRREAGEMIRAERSATRLFLVAQLAPLRRRIEDLEAHVFAPPTRTFLDTYAESRAAEYAAPEEADE